MSPFYYSPKNFPRTYGWDVALTCSNCRLSGLPRYEGWSSHLETNQGGNIRIYAKISCPKCGNRLSNEAAGKLMELFQGIEITEQNRKITSRFILWLFLVPALLAFVLFFGMQMDWWTWGLGTLWILIASAIAIPLILSARNRKLAQLPQQCECGKPHPVFMGSMDNEQCFRCFSCGRLIKVRE